MKSALFWFRRDLRTTDNAGLFHALDAAERVYCVFVFDRTILDALPRNDDRRVEFIWESVRELRASLQARGGELLVLHAHAAEAIPLLAKSLAIDAVFTNEDYEPAARARDAAVAKQLAADGIDFQSFKDTVIFAKDEVLTQTGGIYSVFTPYKNAWRKRLSDADLRAYDVAGVQARLATPAVTHQASKSAAKNSWILEFDKSTLADIGIAPTNLRALGVTPGERGARALAENFVERIADYKRARDFPAVKGVSYLSVHNRFGTISIRQLAALAYAETLRGVNGAANEGAETWLNELVWRDFYFQILWHHPQVVSGCYKPQYNALRWENNPDLFAAWCEARTGYPIIDAAMRQLNQTGYMHNRLRMIVASFLTKDLLIDWRWGEKYFADNLIDFDLAANNGGWQWAASTGCDAQPYFRIFNPVSQSERFDPQGKFIRRYLPELANVPDKFIHAPWTLPPLEQQAIGCMVGRETPTPIVDHAEQREKALAMYEAVKKSGIASAS